jgi:cytochrome o ubiquinol oxidase subunit 2
MQTRHKNTKKRLFIVTAMAALAVVVVVIIWLSYQNVAIFNPKGIIAHTESRLIITALLIMLVAVLPALIMTYVFAYRYKASDSVKQMPNWNHKVEAEFLMWGLPCVVVLILSVMTWKVTHKVDPFKAFDTSTTPMTIQVVALQWKWLFIYPEEKIATVNFVEFPANTPINFVLTADAPMNSFWIPQLGGQMYAMAGMSTKLHLMASEPGEFPGSAAEISGAGFASMRFVAKSATHQEFHAWVASLKNSGNVLDTAAYNKLATPSENTPVTLFAFTQPNLYEDIMMKFTMPGMAEKIENRK